MTFAYWNAKSICALFAAGYILVFAHATTAHEVRPAIADIEVTADSVDISIRLSLESLVAGIDLRGITDTDEAPNAADYDALRALAGGELEDRLRSSWPDLRKTFHLTHAGTPLVLELSTVSIPETGDTSLPRDSRLQISAAAPGGTAQGVVFGWSSSNGPLIVRQVGAGDDAYSAYLRDGAVSDPIMPQGSAARPVLRVFADYIVIGFEHILPKGLDHILFVLGLFFFAFKLRPLLIQVTAFTVAHTITLALAILGIVTVPASIVEPLIAASIVYVAVENVFGGALKLWRTAIVFCFGLLHGLGFASVLADIGLAPARFAVGLIGFNIGVELGQLTVIATATFVIAWPFARRPWYRQRVAVPASIAIACIGAYWFIDRLGGWGN